MGLNYVVFGDVLCTARFGSADFNSAKLKWFVLLWTLFCDVKIFILLWNTFFCIIMSNVVDPRIIR